ncbi:hypothetical protein NB703_004318 [Pantoea ananatis]|uniref:Uncharacterized protein n=1 Tax=Pantoea ananas TaxID=553 RepID=A0AAJ1D2Z9_PANAN|nr:hypothetical protein [Pantoea ananatis]MCW0346225.1 hypothetical protein [Pantoea ananatis]
MTNKKFTNEGNSYSPAEIVAYWAGYGCRTCWLLRTVNSLGENLLVLLDEENGVYEEMASRLDAPDMKDWSVQLSGTALTFSSLPAGAVEIDLSIPAEAAFKMDLL